jgi:hypothetical protein
MAYEIYNKTEQALQRDSHAVYNSKPHKRVVLDADGNERLEQERNDQDHLRVYDPTQDRLLQEILLELRKLNFQLKTITEEDIENGNY